MPDVALIGDRTFLYEKLFSEAGLDCQFIRPEMLASPFLPRYRMIIIPTGFANPQYSCALPHLRSARSSLSRFVNAGGVLLIFGPLVTEHDYDWLPVALSYSGSYSQAQQLSSGEAEDSCICPEGRGDCDGYLTPGEGVSTLLRDAQNRPVLCSAELGQGIILATTIHEFPSAQFLQQMAGRGRPAKI
ncbi:MAG: hypothetical protein A4E45_02179 [Methanosaeta sp. PtaB.Bin039]|nr:MAG: hypothetical protein A4E45_02179 [Methanosaeta sp. PtaB.Bin039]HOT06105.1 hypothetical protein [Methanotrichaceae archaeon]HQF16245.1 hypothetical protein [Methanotrichaceae archaeon]HQI90017.1 hypothetical protein [Methanotrichaceae archaeon]HQJ27959.1 hypothetical protein [Methanotrichaceae archaeon]